MSFDSMKPCSISNGGMGSRQGWNPDCEGMTEVAGWQPTEIHWRVGNPPNEQVWQSMLQMRMTLA